MPSFQGASSPLLLAMPVFIAAALLGYQVGRMALRAKQELEEAEGVHPIRYLRLVP